VAVHPDNFNPKQAGEFSALKDLHLKVARAWVAKELFCKFWNYQEEGWARIFFKNWYGWVSRSRLKPVIEVARMLKRCSFGANPKNRNSCRHRFSVRRRRSLPNLSG
jgi:hypothetical protein